MENTPTTPSTPVVAEKKGNYVFLRIIVIGAILILLVFLSIGIVRIVPKALNSLANASLSIGSLIDTQNSTSTDGTTNPNGNVDNSSTGGFSIRELTDRNLNTSGNNYVPASSTLPSQYQNPGTISGNTSGIGSSNNAGNNSGNTSGSNNTNYNTATANTVGLSDIAVTVISQGVISKTTGAFVATNSFTTSDLVVVKFKIENRGQYATGSWSARVDMPSNNSADKVRSLGPIKSLPAGTSITGEARFDNPTSGNTAVVITVDTGNTTNDSNRNNNTVTQAMYVSGNNSGNGNTGGNPIYGSAADLQIRTLATGSVNQYGQFVANVAPRYGEKAAVQFEVSNIGGTATSPWSWKADVTGALTNTYNAPVESGLAPGASIRFIVGFDVTSYGNYSGNYNYSSYGNNCQLGPYDIYTGAYIGNNCSSYNNSYSNQYGNGNAYGNAMYFNIMIDTTNTVYESNEGNNTASTTVNIAY